jgi:hypothetical protein
MDPEEHARIPSLTVPFALVGMAAAVFSLSAVSAFREGARAASPVPALLAGGLAGLLVGALLRRWRALHNPMFTQDAAFRVAVVVMPAGGLVGAIVGYAAWAEEGLAPFGIGGAVLAIAVIPACTTVLEAGRRAARARLGSVVAGADRRTVWGTTFSVIAVTALAGLPAILVGCGSSNLSVPQQASLVLATAVLCVIGASVLAWQDKRGMVELQTFAVTERLEEAGTRASEAVGCVDLGLGDGAWAPAGGASTYRSSMQREALLRGDLHVALRALDDAVRRRARTQTLAALAIVAALATSLSADVRPVGVDGCFRRVDNEGAMGWGCGCVEKSYFRSPSVDAWAN